MIRSYLIIILLGLTANIAHAQFPREAKPRMSAIVIGVTKYECPRFKQLRFANRDAEQFARLLKCAENVQVDTVITLLDEKATVGNLDMALACMNRLLSDTSSRKPDYVVFYFSGHGQLNNSGPKKKGYFILHNTDNASSLDMGYPNTDLIEYVEEWKRYSKKVVRS